MPVDFFEFGRPLEPTLFGLVQGRFFVGERRSDSGDGLVVGASLDYLVAKQRDPLLLPSHVLLGGFEFVTDGRAGPMRRLAPLPGFGSGLRSP